MALLFSDSFDDRPIGAIGDRYDEHQYNVSAGSAISVGRTGSGLALSTGILDEFDHITWQSETTHQSLYAGVARQPNRGAIISIRLNGTPHIFANYNADGTISVIRYDGGLNTVLSTSSRTVSADVEGFYYCELYGKIDTVNGAYELRVNGTRWLSASGLNTSSTGDNFANQVRLINNSAIADGVTTIVDDFYVADDDSNGGTAEIVGFAGPVKIEYLQVNGDGLLNEWTSLFGSHYEQIDESGKDSDSTYVYTATEGSTDLFILEDVEVPRIEIKAVAVHQWARKEDVLPRSVVPIIRVGGIDYPGDEELLGTDYERVFYAWERNPATNLKWTLAQVNSANVGIQLVAQ